VSIVPNSMTLNDLERQNRGFYGFLGDFGLRDTFQERIAPKPIEIDRDKLRTKLLASNVDFDGLSLDFLDSRKLAHEGIKDPSVKFVNLPLLSRNCYRLSRVS